MMDIYVSPICLDDEHGYGACCRRDCGCDCHVDLAVMAIRHFYMGHLDTTAAMVHNIANLYQAGRLLVWSAIARELEN